jgi:hypothetical protein
LVDTISELSRGNRELFDGLWIETNSDYKFDKHPILNISADYAEVSSKEDLSEIIKSDLWGMVKSRESK